ncbi:hypothetical protein DSO57_1021054 [Entomophthora muscae]|uniref:Uncharacterized protein n=1 Tax=Entomophthora muscae TaxID=34485 RepID=A0ACC2SGI5_9FUNG|nr:hypothetical protein DSO57_1021054 [Entomophthora muscae]
MRFTPAKLLAIVMVSPVLAGNVLHCFGNDFPLDIAEKVCKLFTGVFKQEQGCVLASSTICNAASKFCQVLGSKDAACK